MFAEIGMATITSIIGILLMGSDTAFAQPDRGLPALKFPSAQHAALGRDLFYDPILSIDGTQSCASCHNPDDGWTETGRKSALSRLGGSLSRNTPTLLNVFFYEKFSADGAIPTLSQQSLRALLLEDELGNPSKKAVIGRLLANNSYQQRFKSLTGKDPNWQSLGEMLAAYQQTLIAGDSPFDRWLYGGQADALNGAEKRGYDLFRNKAQCSACHLIGQRTALFIDHRFHNTGVGLRGSNADLGRMAVTGKLHDRYKFKTPTLRNIAVTAPYMHDGSIRTLKDAVAFYNKGGGSKENLDPLIHPLFLTEKEIADLVAFLNALTSKHLHHIDEF